MRIDTWAHVAQAMGLKLSFRGAKSSSFRTGWVLPTNTTVDLIELPDTADVRLFRGQADRLETITCFCSLYKDCWTSSSRDPQPKDTKVCQANPGTQFKE